MRGKKQPRIDLDEIHPNAILEALPPKYKASLLERMELVPLAASQLLVRPRETPRYAHFLVAGVASFTMTLRNGDGLDVAIVGSEGLVEALHLLGSSDLSLEAVMQVQGAAYRISLNDLKAEFLICQELRAPVLRDVQKQTQLTCQLAVCNYFHGVETRLARWLLMMADRTGRLDLELTHGFLAQMLGVRRPTLTLAAKALQREGSIRYRRGSISIVNRAALHHRSCECYENIARLTKQP